MNVASEFQLKLGQTSIEFRAEREELAQAIGHIYRPFVVGHLDVCPCSLNGFTAGGTWRATIDGQEFSVSNFDIALRAVEEFVAERLLESVADCLLIHSGAVCDTRQNIFLVGRSGSGKTTLSLELVRRGMLYLTDEYSAIEKGGNVIRPFPRSATRKFDGPIPIGTNLEIPELGQFRSHMLPENRSGLEPRPIQSSRIIFPVYQAGATPTARLLDSAETCTRLMPSIFGFEGRERIAWPTMANFVTASRACEFRFQNAESDLDLALDLLS